MRYFTILFILFCTGLFAEGTLPVGTGTETDPYLIATLDNLLYLSTNTELWLSGIYFLQTADIDASDTQNWNGGAGFSPIGSDADHTYCGSYNGDNHTISGLYINRSLTYYNIGLFGRVYSGAELKNIGLVDVNVTGDGVTGGLMGANAGTITNCYSTGSVTGDYGSTGGLVGSNLDDGNITNSYSTGTVTGLSATGGLVGRNYGSITNSYSTGSVTGNYEYTGGLVGENYFGTVTNSYSTGNVTGYWCVGGLVGYNDEGTITNSYSTGDITGDDYTGGLVGEDYFGTVTNSYSTGSVTGGSTIGGLVGFSIQGTTTSSYWNIETSGQTTSAGGEGRTTDEMTYPYAENTYVSWSFTEIWQADENYEYVNGYPYLRDNPPTIGAGGIMPEGSGTETDPYLIASLDNLLYLSTYSELCIGRIYFLQTADIDASDTQNWNDGSGFSPIGLSWNYLFCGSYDGDNHTISGLSINRPEEEHIGLFRLIDSWAEIKNLGLVDVNVTGSLYTGGLVGGNSGTITNCYSTGNVTGNDYTGGLVGKNHYGTITNCYSTGNVTGNIYTGGLVGGNSGTITNCYSTGNVTGNWSTGGLVGYSIDGFITNSYSTGTVIGNWSTGGLVGVNGYNGGTITNCYSTGNVTGEGINTGGLVGSNSGAITNSYWNIEISGQTTSAGGEGRTTDEMTYPYAGNTYVYWDFELVWLEDINYEHNNGYPYIREDAEIGIDEDDDELINQHSALKISNYPNPFRMSEASRGSATTISFSLPETGEAAISIYNIKGQKIKELLNETLPAGEYSVVWNGRDDSGKTVASGVYFTRLSVNGKNIVKKMMLMK